MFYRFAAEIENGGKLICEIESLSRGLLFKDTKKYGISILIEYLQYFSNWTYSAKEIKYSKLVIFCTYISNEKKKLDIFFYLVF